MHRADFRNDEFVERRDALAHAGVNREMHVGADRNGRAVRAHREGLDVQRSQSLARRTAPAHNDRERKRGER
jgi:hypothetical protein